MLALISLFLIVLASLLVTRVAAVMLTLTGLSAQSARFQARSAFSGAGFTTSESEAVVNHPVRRRIIMTLMLLGNAGIVSGVASLLLSFTNTSSLQSLVQIVAIVVFLLVLIRVSQSATVDRFLSRFIERALRRFTRLEIRDYAGLLRLTGDWIIGELLVEHDDWLCGRTIEDLQLTGEGVLVLGIERADRRYVGAPKGTARFHEGDTAILYGLRDTIARIDARERTEEGELDWVTSQIEFTERYLAQQDQERKRETDEEPEAPDDEPRLHVGRRSERPEHEDPGAEDPGNGDRRNGDDAPGAGS